MTVVTLENFQPTPRYDDTPWTEAKIQEAATATALNADWTTIDTIALDPVDVDPEHPASRDFTTENASDTAGLWYRVIFLDGDGDELLPTVPVQNVAADTTAYATVDELARVLKLRTPTDEQTNAMERVLLAAAGEINAEIDLEDDEGLPSWGLALAQEVNLERAVEHWRQQESPFGIVGLSGDLGATYTARDSWDRHALKLAPLKSQWGIA